MSEETVIRPGEPLAIAEQFRALEASSGLRIETALFANNIALIKSLVAQGIGITVVSLLDVAAEIAEGNLGFAPLADPTLRTTTLALCTKGRYPAPRRSS